MNFFEHQDRARRQSAFLVFLFSLAVLGIVVAVNVVVVATMGPDPALLAGATGLTAGTMLVASWIRSLQLRGGGGEVARSMGATLVEPDPGDPLRRRLRNVVEEMAIASGVPVPEIYVMEHEQGINAFAAGYSVSDAAVAVTRGALEHLDRDELQGVIAHEFSHILNGDMRLNIRLIGFLFGILVIAIAGRRLLFSARYARNSRDTAPLVFIGLAIVIVGYIGLFFGRWIRTAVSRQREYLADASAVQFTRQPDGIAGALKKIGALHAGSFMTTDSEEVGHMLFGRGMGRQMFATHPPLEARIRAIDPSFDPAELEAIKARLDRHAQSRQADASEEQASPEPARRGPGGLPVDAGNLAETIGQPGLNQVLIAAALAAALPEPLKRAAHSDEWAPELICRLLLSDDEEIREQQLLQIARTLGDESERQVRALRNADPALSAHQRLPLLEMAFPSLRRRPEAELVEFMRLIDVLVSADGRMAVFEYALARLISHQIKDALRPERARPGGRKRLLKLSDQAVDLLSILALLGHPESRSAAEAAYAAALEQTGLEVTAGLTDLEGWPQRLDRALRALDQLCMKDKQVLLEAMLACVRHDGVVSAKEMDLLRVICGLLHVPIPLL